MTKCCNERENYRKQAQKKEEEEGYARQQSSRFRGISATVCYWRKFIKPDRREKIIQEKKGKKKDTKIRKSMWSQVKQREKLVVRVLTVKDSSHCTLASDGSLDILSSWRAPCRRNNHTCVTTTATTRRETSTSMFEVFSSSASVSTSSSLS